VKEAQTTNATALAEPSHRETAATYRRVIVTHGRYRVAICRNGTQWLFQKCTHEKSCAGARWKTVGCFVTREALIALQHRATGAHWPSLAALPARFTGEGQE